MKFEHNGIHFEVSHIDHIIINTVRRIIKPQDVVMDGRGHTSVKPARVTNKKERVEEKGTRVWFRLKFAKGTRWAKFRYHGEIPDVPEDLKDAEEFESPDVLHGKIMEWMQRPDIRLWFSGTYVNIEICENYQEVRRIQAQEASRKSRARAAKILKSGNVSEIIQNAIRTSAAQLRQSSVETPFGPVRVMRITRPGVGGNKYG